MLGISKVMTVTCTYDHRIIQGAESGMFLGRLQALLRRRGRISTKKIFATCKMPHKPVHWEPDRHGLHSRVCAARSTTKSPRKRRSLQLINAYRVRGHLIADLDPLGSEPVYHPELDPATYGLTIWDLDREFLTGTLDVGGRSSRRRSPRCARFWKPCARPTAARSAAST